MASNGSKNDKPPKAKTEMSYSVESNFTVDGATVYFHEMELPYTIVISESKSSPYSYTPVGKPDTKFHAKHLFHPLKLC